MATILIIETAQHADGELIALFLQALERGGARQQQRTGRKARVQPLAGAGGEQQAGRENQGASESEARSEPKASEGGGAGYAGAVPARLGAAAVHRRRRPRTAGHRVDRQSRPAP